MINLLCELVSNRNIRSYSIHSLSKEDWEKLYELSASQGLLAIVWDAIISTSNNSDILTLMPKNLKIRWALGYERIIAKNTKQYKTIYEICEIFFSNGIKPYCLKGLTLSKNYPKPELRECGDFDCWLNGDFEKGNCVAIAYGAILNPHDYRHSHIYFNGLTIENHKYFLTVRGDFRNKRLEQYMRTTIYNDTLINSYLYCPSSQFHAIFIVLHMLRHFLYESITLRHMLDWTYFVNAEKENIDWREFNEKCREAGADKFVAALNHICSTKLGLDISGTLLECDDRYADKIFRDTIDQASHHISGIQGLWQQRYAKVKNIVAQRWKFNEIYDRNFLQAMLQSAVGILLDRNVKL